MNTKTRLGRTRIRRVLVWAMLPGTLILGGCGTIMSMAHGRVSRPAPTEFGFGPRSSTAGLYVATVEPEAPLRTRKLQRVTLTLRTADAEPVEGAVIEIGGGMPQHGHGLPTAPRVTKSLGGGKYLVDGLKFNMGGWWELTFRIAAPTGTDIVTFNVDL